MKNNNNNLQFDKARQLDEVYIKKNSSSNYKYFPEAVRVEQGEYAVVKNTQSLGTHNIRQCVVIYAHNKEKNIHGLAHVDGHTEVSSLKTFFEELQLDSLNGNKIDITIFGAGSNEMSSGLDIPEKNLQKVKGFLEDIKNSINMLADYTGTNHKIPNIVISNNEGKMQVNSGFAGGNTTINRALHAIQEVRRKNGFLGTYNVIEGYDGTNPFIYLDERALLKLREYEHDPTKLENEFKSGRHEEEFNEAVPEIISCWNTEIDNIIEQSGINSSDNSKEISKLMKKTPIYIGPDVQNKNKDLIKLLQDIKGQSPPESLVLDLENAIRERNFEINKGNTATIAEAINIATKYDKNVDSAVLLEVIQKNYNKKHQTNLTKEEIAHKKYGAEILAEDFSLALQAVNSILFCHQMLNEYLSPDNQRLTYQDVIDNLKKINPKIDTKALLKMFTEKPNQEILKAVSLINSDRIKESKYSVDALVEKDEFVRVFENLTKDLILSRASKIAISKGPFESVKEHLEAIEKRLRNELDSEKILELQTNIVKKLEEMKIMKGQSQLMTEQTFLQKPYSPGHEKSMLVKQIQELGYEVNIIDFNYCTIALEMAQERNIYKESQLEKQPLKGKQEIQEVKESLAKFNILPEQKGQVNQKPLIFTINPDIISNNQGMEKK